MNCSQANRPDHFRNRWTVGCDAWENPDWAFRECEVLGYERDPETDRDVVRVRFLDQRQLVPEEAVMSPHMLFPVMPGEERA